MNTIAKVMGLAFLLFAGTSVAGLDPQLEALAPFVGRTYEGSFTGPDGAAMTDVQKWESILGGKAVRIMHSLNDGEYGGETLVYWDSASDTLAFFYATTGGFQTRGTMSGGNGTFTAVENVSGNPDGITEVRSTSRVLEDGRMHLTSEYLKDGEWVPGHEIYYTENPEAEVVFE